MVTQETWAKAQTQSAKSGPRGRWAARALDGSCSPGVRRGPLSQKKRITHKMFTQKCTHTPTPPTTHISRGAAPGRRRRPASGLLRLLSRRRARAVRTSPLARSPRHGTRASQPRALAHTPTTVLSVPLPESHITYTSPSIRLHSDDFTPRTCRTCPPDLTPAVYRCDA